VGVDTDLNGVSCGLAGGNRYITDAQANLTEAFGCIAWVGTNGAVYEFALDAQIFATSDEYNANDGSCFHDAVGVIDTACEEFEPPG
jgi:hypothetical protein